MRPMTMIDYGLKNKVALVTGANNPWGIGATTAMAFAREGAKVVLVYNKVDRPFDATKTDKNGNFVFADVEPGKHSLTALKDGKTLYIEIKTATGKQSQWQIEFQETCEAHGGTYILARSVKDVQPWLTRVRPLF